MTTSTSVGLILVGRAEFFQQNAHKMPVVKLKSEAAYYESLQHAHHDGVIQLTAQDIREIDAVLDVINTRLDAITPIRAADIGDHDYLCGDRAREVWPDHLPLNTLKIHWHLCEVLHAWNLNPYRVNNSIGVVSEAFEAKGVTCFSFTSAAAMNEFVEYNFLDDFIIHDSNGEADANGYVWLTLVNKFTRSDSDEFLAVLKDATNQLAVIHNERTNAIRNDGGRVGYITVDHFAVREAHQMNRIRQAREKLGATLIAR